MFEHGGKCLRNGVETALMACFGRRLSWLKNFINHRSTDTYFPQSDTVSVQHVASDEQNTGWIYLNVS